MADLPLNAVTYLPVLVQEVCSHWEDAPHPVYLPAQVEQETCSSLKSKRCWNPRTELKTEREYGFGLGQITVTSRFNVFNEAKALDLSLKNWKWEDRYDPAYQLRTLVLMDRRNYNTFKLATSTTERMAFALAAYNGGVGGTLNDIKMCRATPDCDSSKWFGNVEHTSLKSRTKWQGYGQSFFEINRGYVHNIIHVRFQKYQAEVTKQKEKCNVQD